MADELRKEIQSLRIRVEQLESELDSKNNEIKALSSSNRTSEVQVGVLISSDNHYKSLI